MKKYFLPGLVLLLPVIFTIAIVAFLVSLFTDPFINMIESIFQTGSLSSNKPLLMIVRLFILAVIFSFIILIGFLTQTFFINSLLEMTDRMMQRIPVVNKVYKALQEVMQTLFSSDGTSFKQVVLVRYPNDSSWSIGFTTTDTISSSEDPKLKDKIPVFVPGAPNPTFGFILFFPREKVLNIDMKVEEAFKLLVSCGIMLPSEIGNKNETKA
jgi:uncharacterized membrane protein